MTEKERFSDIGQSRVRLDLKGKNRKWTFTYDVSKMGTERLFKLFTVRNLYRTNVEVQ